MSSPKYDPKRTFRNSKWNIVGHDIDGKDVMFDVAWNGYSDFSTLESVKFVLKEQKKVRDYLKQVKAKNFIKFDKLIKLAPELAEAFKVKKKPTKDASSSKKRAYRDLLAAEENMSSDLSLSTDPETEFDPPSGSDWEVSVSTRLSTRRRRTLTPKTVHTKLQRKDIITELRKRCFVLSSEAEVRLESIPKGKPDIEGTEHLVAQKSEKFGGFLRYLGAEPWHDDKIEAVLQVYEHFSILHKAHLRTCVYVPVFEVRFENRGPTEKLLASEVLKKDPIAVLRFLEAIRRNNRKRFCIWETKRNFLFKLYNDRKWLVILREIEEIEKASMDDYLENYDLARSQAVKRKEPKPYYNDRDTDDSDV